MRDQIVIKRIKKGDSEALHELIEVYYPQVYQYLYCKMQMDDRAKDITQEVFLRFIKSIPTYHHEGKLIHYLFVIASNACKDQYKKQMYEEDIDQLEYKLEDHLNTESEVLHQLESEQLMYYIGLLNHDQQNVILLKYFHQLTFQEIADMFDKPLSTIKSRHTGALLKLRNMLDRGDYL